MSVAPLRSAIAERILGPADPATVGAVSRRLVDIAEGEVLGILFFGSRRTGARPDPHSAWDLFVLTPRRGRGFYRRLRAAGALHRSDLMMSVLQRWLPPNQLSFAAGPDLRAKLAVMSMDRLLRETSAARRDHFVAGRLCQPTSVAWAASDREREGLLDAVESAHRQTWSWVRPWLPERFTVDDYVRTFLRVSFAWEIRPEPGGRADALFASQQDYHRAVYGALLEELAASGELRRLEPASDGGGNVFGVTVPPSAAERRRRSWYFRRSMVRATARWGKHVFTFEGWLDFLLRKVRRHGGGDIELTERERRLPLVFLWPRLFRYLRHKDGGGGA